MKVLVLTEYPPSAAGLATQGQLLCRGLSEIGVDVHPVHFESPQEKEWYYRWFQPDVVAGIGFWGHVPHLVLHPQQFGMRCVPWLLADGYVAANHEVLNALPLILVTSNWVKETFIGDGIRGDNIEVLPVGCDTDAFAPRSRDDLKVRSIREALGVTDGQIMILTVGGDAASKGAQEVMQALALIDAEAPKGDMSVRSGLSHARSNRTRSTSNWPRTWASSIRSHTPPTSSRTILCPICWPPAISTQHRRGWRASE